MTTKKVLVMAVLLGMAATVAVAQEKRVFELRTYFAPPGRLDDLHARFRNHTLKIFEKHGMKNFAYWTPSDKSQGAENTLVYLLIHDSPAAAEKSFKAFRADADWLAAKKASETNGSLTTEVKSVMMRPTDYSPAQ